MSRGLGTIAKCSPGEPCNESAEHSGSPSARHRRKPGPDSPSRTEKRRTNETRRRSELPERRGRAARASPEVLERQDPGRRAAGPGGREVGRAGGARVRTGTPVLRGNRAAGRRGGEGAHRARDRTRRQGLPVAQQLPRMDPSPLRHRPHRGNPGTRQHSLSHRRHRVPVAPGRMLDPHHPRCIGPHRLPRHGARAGAGEPGRRRRNPSSKRAPPRPRADRRRLGPGAHGASPPSPP